MADRREFLKSLSTLGAVSMVPALKVGPSAPPAKVIFVHAGAIGIEALCSMENSALGECYVVAVYPPLGMSVRDCICTSSEMEDIHILDKKDGE